MGIMSGAANDRWREAQKECEILRRANDDYIKTATEQCLRIATLETENKAIRLLHRVEIEGRLARITALEAELARLRAELAAVKTDLGRQCQIAVDRAMTAEAELAAARELCGMAADRLEEMDTAWVIAWYVMSNEQRRKTLRQFDTVGLPNGFVLQAIFAGNKIKAEAAKEGKG